MSPTLATLRFTLPTDIGLAVYPPGATFGPRMLRDHEFVWVIEGDAEYRRGDRTEEAPAGSVLLCRPAAGGEMRTDDFFRWDPRRRTRHAYFHFAIESIPPSWPPPDQWPLVRRGSGGGGAEEGDILRPLFRHLLTWNQRGDRLLMELGIAQMLAAYVLGQTDSHDVGRDLLPDAVERALAHLHERLERNPAAPIPLNDLAEAAAVSPEHLCRLFKSATGLSPAETVRLARLDRAAMLLARSNYSVNQIAALCGFASPFHFSRRFKEAYGQAPTVLRAAVASGHTPPVPRLLRMRKGL
jgi:AraC-like DNA-binding protein